jgi:sugar lactone lactonase YvrE
MTRLGLVLTLLACTAALAIGGAAAVQQAGTAGTYKVVGKWGSNGSANGQFLNAQGVTVDEAGNVYVADTDNNRVQVFTGKGAFVRKWGSQGLGNGQFVDPQHTAIGPDGSVWVADLKNARVQQFSKSGAFQTALGTPKQALGVAVDGEGNVYASTSGDQIHSVVRFDKTPTGYSGASTFAGGFASPADVEASADGSIYVADNSTLTVKRYSAGGKLLKTIKGGPSAPLATGVDLDCNLWIGNISQRRMDLYSPSGKRLGSATSPDLIAQDVAVGPKGDLYAVHTSPSSVIRWAEDKKPATAGVPGTITVTGGKARVRFALPGVSCPAQVASVATLKGPGVSGKATVKVAAGKTTVITMPVKAPKGTTKATFTIVLKTNGRPTTQTKAVSVKA